MSAHLKQVTRTVKSLDSSGKYVFAGAVILIVGLFLPWFSVNINDLFAEESTVTNAFTGLTYIIGYLCYFFAITAINTIDKKLTIIVAGITFLLFLPSLTFERNEEGITLLALFLFLLCNVGLIFALDTVKMLKRMPKNVLNLFVGIESVILIFVASMIYHKTAWGQTSANLNFGVYTSLAGAILILYGGYTQMKLNKKANIKEVFASTDQKLHGGVNLKPDLNIDKADENKNNDQEEKENSQLSFGDYD